MLRLTKRFFTKHFPDSKEKWWLYFKYAFPTILSGVCFSLNNFVDNFMVLGISGGPQALGYANFYTSIILAIFLGIGFIGAVMVGQYLGAKKVDKVREIISLRIILSAIVVIVVFVLAWTIPNQMIQMVAGPRREASAGSYDEAVKLAKDYMQYISIAWILLIFTFTSGNLLREIGLGKYSLYSTLVTLGTNVLFNSLFMYVLNLGVIGAALASIIARVSALIMNYIFIYIKQRELCVFPWQMGKISPIILIQFLKRCPSILLSASAVAFNTVRQIFYNSAQTVNAYDIMNVSVLAITATFTGVFTAAFSSFSANVTRFVGMHLGNNEIEVAITNGNHLKGFHFTMQALMSIVCSSLLFILPHITIFSDAAAKNWQQSHPDASLLELAQMKSAYVKYLNETLIIILVFSPFWAWFITSSRLISSGGKNNVSSSVEFATGALQILWLALLTYVFIGYFHWKLNVSQFYLIFFLSDIAKMAVFEIVYYSIKWARNITKEHYESKLKKS
ncbi:MATE family efflux transporter [Mycoplasmopsis gallopavonis]|uniref:Probable multidrug resistance protein NorM n=1 Tax=Mycoplasmopsis gallopavonis TaxID=76629 RepID=A0A449AYL5_9BACT|nr:MATE family efflux transporter [Mycoplasmopsis gallopavonis]RIV16747.1 MATE family efflux transporter [Mycoplasmopsis gallopavonis]VEU72565.1 MATE efflux family protein [Mycoplasmopsis gallopavonis]